MQCYEPDREFEDTSYRILCNRCRHKRDGVACDAFPDGIPTEILRSGAHFLPVRSHQSNDFLLQKTLARGGG